MKFLKALRNATLAALVMAFLIAAAGVTYALIADRRAPAAATNSSESVRATVQTAPKLPGDNAKEGVAIQSLTPLAKPGSTMFVSAITNATSLCKIAVDPSVVSKANPALAPVVADSYGSVSWTWAVDRGATSGNKSLAITCAFHGRTGVVSGSFKVTP